MPVVSDYTALISGDSWNGLEITNTPAVVTYSFAKAPPAADAATMGAAYSTFAEFTDVQKQKAIDALNEWGNASGITFVQVAPGTGDITFSAYDFTNSGYSGAGGVGFYPFGDWNYYVYPHFLDGWQGAGDVLMNTAFVAPDGTFAYTTMLHEIGHALGLKHPLETFNNGASGTNHDQTLDPATEDGTQTVMTEKANSLLHLTALDIAAVQSMYGTDAMDGTEYASWAYNAATNSFTFAALAAGGFTRGSSLNDTITGSANSDTMVGLYGHDSLDGGAGNDALFGGSGNDTLNGGPGNDSLYGGKDNDTYYIDNPSDWVVEFAGEGLDLVNSTVTYTLTDNVENLTLTANNINGTGNGLDNVIRGNNGTNVLTGLDGNDTLLSGGGTDTVDGGNGNDYLDGGNGNDVIDASDGADTIIGGAGNDTMTGGAGADLFVFAAAGAANGIDRINDFVHGTDWLVFTGADYGFAAGHSLTAAEFTTGTTAVGTSAQFVWNPTSHILYWDPDGSGATAAVAITSFYGTPTVDATDLHFM